MGEVGDSLATSALNGGFAWFGIWFFVCGKAMENGMESFNLYVLECAMGTVPTLQGLLDLQVADVFHLISDPAPTDPQNIRRTCGTVYAGGQGGVE